MSEDLNEEVILEVEDTAIKCKKQDLIKHSDYFKAMFEGNFVERNKKVIKLEAVTLNTMNIILMLLTDYYNPLLIEKEDDALAVLQTSCMLQFNEIQTMCVNKLINTLSPTNCVRIWLFAELLGLKTLYLKAKSMALTEFNIVKDSDIIMEFELNQLHAYLANTSLRCKSELDVFQVCMKWWYENAEKLQSEINKEHLESFRTDTFINLLSCLDFNNISDSDVEEIMVYPDLSKNTDVIQILKCIISIKNNDNIDYNPSIITKAKELSNSKPRSCKQLPCISVHNIPHKPTTKKLKLSSPEKETLVVYYDAYKRKRYYTNIENSESAIVVIHHDEKKNGFTKLLRIGKQKCDKLEGCHILGYKEFILLFGGEFVMGYGHWNKNLWVYNTITDSWERTSVMPFARRHFQSCIAGSTLYIIGGTGNYRILQENMFSYNFKEDKWSELINLPHSCSERQIKCCSWNDQLFVFDSNGKCGYIFDERTLLWVKMVISDDKGLAAFLPNNYTVFSYKDSIYIKGDNLIEMKKINQQLAVIKSMPMELLPHEEINSIVCGDIVYTLYKQPSPDIQDGSKTLSFEKYCITTGSVEFIFRDVLEESLLEVQNDYCAFRTTTILFGLQHYELVATDDFVNEAHM